MKQILQWKGTVWDDNKKLTKTVSVILLDAANGSWSSLFFSY
jgi:hypothetical protein